jgi:glycine/sarcosine N-methyltransferase
MNFYTSISSHYDAIFPVDAAEVSFIAKRLTGRKSVLDIGCGTGNKTVHYARAGRKVIAVDADPAMIARAESTYAAPGVSYQVLSMLELDQKFPPCRFDALLCLGNTLVHLPRPEQIREMIVKMAGLLQDGGLAIIQILNYDRILSQKITALPLLETEHIRFERFYARQETEMRFVTKLVVKETGEEIDNDIPLYPLRRGELDERLQSSGFWRTEYYGGGGEPFTDDSFVLFALAWK